MAYELECKIKIPDREPAAAALAKLGAEDHGDRHEENRVFDTPDGKLKNAGQLLRLRRSGREAIVTFKGPAPASKFKNREELEVEIGSLEDFSEILKRLGFVQVWFYEKLRHSFTYRGCEIALDRLPEIGDYIEVEGASEEAIIAVLADLGIDQKQHLKGNYRSLFKAYCEARGEGLRELRF